MGLSHQRVHQIVYGQQQDASRRHRSKCAATGAASVILAMVIAAAVAGVPTPWSPQQGSAGQAEAARLRPVGSTEHATPREATRAVAVTAHPQLDDPTVELLMTFPRDVALDARVRVSEGAFCRVYSARGIQRDGEVRWASVGQGIPCRSAQVPQGSSHGVL